MNRIQKGEAGPGSHPSHPSVREIPARQRPRERLAREGARALSVRELLALVIGSGSGGGSVLALADRILSSTSGSLRPLTGAIPGELEAIPGVGRATACRIVAALELGLRAAEEEGPDRPRIRGPGDVHRLMAPRLRDLPHEEFHVLLLNTQHRVLREVLVTRGILDASLIHPREVFRPAILTNAAAVILVHNHPSGDPSPSAEDRAVSRQLTEAGRTVGIRVLDHIVVATEGWASAAA
ncbi:MAG: DNA repair protein RadC [Gemmatimonadota bacterium]